MQQLLRQLSIRQRLLGAMAAVSLLILGLGALSSASYHALQTQTDQLLAQQSRVSQGSADLLSALERLQRFEQSVLLTGNNAVDAAEHKTAWDKAAGEARQRLEAAASASELPAEVAAKVAPGRQALKAYLDEAGPVLQQVVDAKLDASAGFAYVSRAHPALEEARAAVVAWSAATTAAVTQNREQARQQGQLQSNIRLAIAVSVLLSFIGLMAVVARSIADPLKDAAAQTRRIAEGDLGDVPLAAGRDEVHQFLQSMAQMRSQLREVVAQVRDSAENIHTASVEVASGNLDLSQRTEHTASNLQQTAASLEQLTGTVTHSAASARQAHDMAHAANSIADRGGAAVEQVVQTMGQIQSASHRIADITGVIDGIAFQTNILALNAAVEAARAGEQGRGFAVVAAEVRTLAQRSAEAAKEIKALIGASVDQVESGSRQVREAGHTMGELVNSVKQVSHILGEISHASQEQSQGIGQVNSAVTELDHMTQQNAALVEQSAAAAESLKSQAGRLTTVVAHFKIHDGASA